MTEDEHILQKIKEVKLLLVKRERYQSASMLKEVEKDFSKYIVNKEIDNTLSNIRTDI